MPGSCVQDVLIIVLSWQQRKTIAPMDGSNPICSGDVAVLGSHAVAMVL